MQIGNVTNQYINTYINEGTQVANQQYVQNQQKVEEYNQAQWQREQEKRQYQWMKTHNDDAVFRKEQYVEYAK